jgi:putative ABC transport system permease protein
MNLFDIAKRNIRKNLKEYLLYFYPMVFSIVIYFTFISVQYNRDIVISMNTLGKLEPAFMTSSIGLIIFSAIFIGYSNSFFTKKRKNELALYSLFGMQKKQIGKLLFFESLMIGLLALALGIGIGTLLSKLFAMILIKLMGFSLIASFTISSKAIFQTIVVFFIIIGATSLYNYTIIYRYTLIQLFKAEKKSEKRVKPSWLLTILSLLLLGSGYAILLQPMESGIWKEHGFNGVLLSLLMITIGTFLFVRSYIAAILVKLSNIDRIYYKGINLITFSHLLYRMRSNVLVLTVIALLSTVTLFAISTTTSLYYNMNKLISENYPVSVMYTIQDEEKETKMSDLLNAMGKKKILVNEKIEYLYVQGDLTSTKRFPEDFPILLISESTYVQLSKKLGIEQSEIKLKGNQAIAFNDGNLNQNNDPFTGFEVGLTNEETVKIVYYQKKSLFNQEYRPFHMVISDEKYDSIRKNMVPYRLHIYEFMNEDTAGETINIVKELYYDENSTMNTAIFSTRYDAEQKLKQTYGIINFISVFLGFVFLLATGSILHFKQLAEATSDHSRYQIFNKLGMNQSQMNKTVSRPLILIFSVPLILAVAHSSIIMTLLSRFLHLQMVLPYAMTIGGYVGIYILYYFNTKRKYLSIVKNKS